MERGRPGKGRGRIVVALLPSPLRVGHLGELLRAVPENSCDDRVAVGHGADRKAEEHDQLVPAEGDPRRTTINVAVHARVSRQRRLVVVVQADTCVLNEQTN